MRVRNTQQPTKIELQMTPMIDIVFQLLVFFIMSFKIVTLEGDFNIKMPVGAPTPGPPDEEQSLMLHLRITASADGRLAGIQLDEVPLESFAALHAELISRYWTDGGPNSAAENAEVQLDCDYHLRYEYVIEAITALSGERVGDNIVKLIEKIKFAPPKKPT